MNLVLITAKGLLSAGMSGRQLTAVIIRQNTRMANIISEDVNMVRDSVEITMRMSPLLWTVVLLWMLVKIKEFKITL